MRILDYVADADDITVKSVLENRFDMSASIITALKNSNGIFLNDTPVTVRKTMYKGDMLKLIIPDIPSNNIVKTPGYIDVLYEDDDILCVNKPSGMPTHPSQKHFNDTLANYVCWYYKDIPFTFRASNRLDRYTSGIVVIAKNMYSASVLCSEKFRKDIKKTYIALCRGILKDKKGIIIAPIDRCDNSTIKRIVSPNGKYAETHYELIQEIDGNSLVRFELKTGRTHQIRVHMSYLGNPLLNDFLYDDYADETKNFILHCDTIKLIHPYTKNLVTINAPFKNND